jgi:hypothetical protein
LFKRDNFKLLYCKLAACLSWHFSGITTY